MNTINSISNIKEYNLAPAYIEGFLNEKLYTDCDSLLLYYVNGKKGMAVRVERDFQPEMDGYFCTNNIKQYAAPIVLTGKPFEVELYRGNWGKWCYDFIGGLFPRHNNEYKPGDIQPRARRVYRAYKK